jgi:anti-sigma B factor antagonist
MEINVREEGGRAVMTPKGKLDEPGSEEMKRRFFALDRNGLDAVVLDFGEVSYVGSACIGKLLLFYKEMFEIGGQIQIVNARPAVYDMLRVVKLDQIIQISRT